MTKIVDTRVLCVITKRMEWEDCIIRMEGIMKASGKIICFTVTVNYILKIIGLPMKVIGFKINFMVMEKYTMISLSFRLFMNR
jgi:hypothetical protein